MSTTTRVPLFAPSLVVQPWSVALERLDGRPTRVLHPGRHRRRRRAAYAVIDLRERVTDVPSQEVPTADGATVKISAHLRWRVGDPVAFAEVAVEPVAQLYQAAQVALRTLVAGIDVEDVAVRVRDEDTGLRATVAPAAGRVGIDLIALDVKDVVLPADLRLARSELVLGRYRAQAKLEAARAETAALRSLANGARVLADNPALARQRLVEALPPGTTLELRAPGE